MQIIQFIPAEIYFKQNVLCIVNILLQVFASENICGIFTLHLDLLTCRLRESEIAGRRNTDLLIHGDFATVRQSLLIGTKSSIYCWLLPHVSHLQAEEKQHHQLGCRLAATQRSGRNTAADSGVNVQGQKLELCFVLSCLKLLGHQSPDLSLCCILINLSNSAHFKHSPLRAFSMFKDTMSS